MQRRHGEVKMSLPLQVSSDVDPDLEQVVPTTILCDLDRTHSAPTIDVVTQRLRHNFYCAVVCLHPGNTSW